METNHDERRRLEFVEDDWQLIEWTDGVLALAARRPGLSPDDRAAFHAMRHAVLALPLVGNVAFDFSVTRPEEPGQPSFGIELNTDVFTLYRVEHRTSYGVEETDVTDDVAVMRHGRIGHQAYSMDEFFAIIWYAIESGSGTIAISGDGGPTGAGPSEADRARARDRWVGLFSAGRE